MAERRLTIPRRVLVVDAELAARTAVSGMVSGWLPGRVVPGREGGAGISKRIRPKSACFSTESLSAMDGGGAGRSAPWPQTKVKIILMAEPGDGVAQALVQAYPESGGGRFYCLLLGARLSDRLTNPETRDRLAPGPAPLRAGSAIRMI